MKRKTIIESQKELRAAIHKLLEELGVKKVLGWMAKKLNK